jgi:hypothetical protein
VTTGQSTNGEKGPRVSGAGPSWENGWYLFDQGQIKGPLTAHEVFGRSESSQKNSTLMVSRKGFTQWYPVKDFASMYHMASRYTDHLSVPSKNHSASVSPVARHVGPDIKDIESPCENNAVAQSIIRAAQHTIVSNPVIFTETARFGQMETKSEHPGAQSPAQSASKDVTITRTLSRKEKKRLIVEERRRRKFAARQAKVARKAARSQSLISQGEFEQLYLETASRLRLGKITSPFLASCLYLPFSFGGYWWAWFARVSEEVSWHLNGASRMNFILPVWMCMVPGAHLILAYLVARMVRQIEEQNGYQTVNPMWATMFAIFPPFYMALIQSALNRHWRLHVYHSCQS